MIDKNKIIGAGGGGKGGGGGGRTPKNDPDSLDSRSHASVLDLIGEGELEGLKTPSPAFNEYEIEGAANPWHQSIILNNTPLQNRDGSYNFKDVTVHARPGTASQAVMPGFEETSSETPVNLVVRKDNPVEISF